MLKEQSQTHYLEYLWEFCVNSICSSMICHWFYSDIFAVIVFSSYNNQVCILINPYNDQVCILVNTYNDQVCILISPYKHQVCILFGPYNDQMCML